jgi:hypothetical protein
MQDQILPPGRQWQHRKETTTPPRGGSWKQQRHQVRHKSDHLKQRAIDALKSRNNVVDHRVVDKEKVDGGIGISSSSSPNEVSTAATTTSIASHVDDAPLTATRPPLNLTPHTPVTMKATTTDRIPTSTASSSHAVPPSRASDDDANSSERRASGKSDAVVGDISPIIQTESSHHHRAKNANTKIIDDADESTKQRPIVDTNPWAHVRLHEFAPKIVVIGVGGAGTNAVNNMVASGLAGEQHRGGNQIKTSPSPDPFSFPPIVPIPPPHRPHAPPTSLTPDYRFDYYSSPSRAPFPNGLHHAM